MVNDQIYITSVYNAVQKAKVKGTLNLKTLQLFNLYRYYINFTDAIIATGDTAFNDFNITLKKEIAKLKYKNPKDICPYKTIIPDDTGGNVDPSNTAPTVDDNTIDMEDNNDYTFVIGDFLVNYADAEGHDPKFLLVYPGPNVDGLLRTGPGGTTEFTSPIIFDIEGLPLTNTIELTYKRNDPDPFGPEIFQFRVSDNPVDYLYSALANMNMLSAETVSENQPVADVGDNTIYVTNRSVTVLTLYMFTGGLTPPYNDPEGDLIDAIRIIDISNANQGTYYLNGIEVTEGQIITREDINAGLFTHESADVDAITSDTFEFEARDEGSGIWVG